MPKIAYQNMGFHKSTLDLINSVNKIIDQYEKQGYSLTLRQVYYQLVSRGVISNTERSYKNIGDIINNARLAGLIDWNSIVDRTRYIRQNSHWDNVADLMNSAAYSYAIDKWATQKYYVEVWVEKDALIGIVNQICSKWDVPCFSCRGYVSQSEMWSTAMRINQIGRQAVILHLGDHDPSGKDMSRDIYERLGIFGANPIFKRIALNMDQIEEYNPPPNPAKVTDSRCAEYIRQFGDSSWELDALEPSVITDLIYNNVLQYLDLKSFNKGQKEEQKEKDFVNKLARNIDSVRAYLGEE